MLEGTTKFLMFAAAWLAVAVAVFMVADSREVSQLRPRRPVIDALRERARDRQAAEGKSEGDSTVSDADRELFITHGGLRRSFYVHVPSEYDGEEKVPLVLNFHGGMGSADSQRRQSQMTPVADKFKFIVVYPNGTGRFRDRILTFNAGNCCGYAEQHQVDDVGFVAAMLDELNRLYSVDTRRVYACGFSNGAMLSYRLACELPERFAAIAAVSGALAVDGPVPARPVPVIHFHGLEDHNAPFKGGIGENQFQPNPHRSVPDTVAFWVKANHCQAQPAEVKTEDDHVMERYAPAADEKGAPVVLYKLPKGGHTWPGGSDISRALNTGHLVDTVDASTIIWKFFEQFQLPEPEAPATPK